MAMDTSVSLDVSMTLDTSKTVNNYDMNVTSNDSDADTSVNSGTALSTMVIIIITFEALLMIIICCGNVLVMAAFHRRKSLRTVTNFFILHLAIADTCVALIIPFHIYIFIDRSILSNIYVCLLRYSSITVTLTASVLCLLAIAVDRHLSIVHPLRYHVIMTQKRARIIIAAVWLSSTGFAFVLPMLWHNKWEDIPDKDCDFLKVMPWSYMATMVPLFIINTLAVLGLYGRIFYIAHARAHRMQRLNLQPKLAFNTNMKIAKTAAIVLGLFKLCWYPFFLIVAIQVYGDLIYSETWEEWRSYATILAIANSAQNPIVYAFRMKKFRTEFKKILGIKPSSNNPHESAAEHSRNSNGDVEVEHSKNSKNVRNSNGDVEVEHSKNSKNVRNSNGDVEVEHSKNSKNVRNSNGDIEVEHSKNSNNVRNSNGDIGHQSH